MTKLQDFAIKIFKQTVSSKGNSLVCSPFGVAALCRIIVDGADEQANNELDNILGISSKELSNIIKDINLPVDKAEDEDSGYEKEAIANSVQLKVANFIAINQDFTIKPTYQSLISNLYGAEAKSIDFSSEEASMYINDWCSRNTNSMIKHIVNKTDNSMLLYALDALYFKGMWFVPFSGDNTKKGKFRKSNRETIQVDMMKKEDDFHYYENRVFKAIALPYHEKYTRKGHQKDFSMYILLPKRNHKVGDIVDYIHEVSFKEVLSSIHKETYDVKVRLPKFSTESDLDVLKILKSIGIKHLFKDANFNGISDGPLTISTIRQKAKIEVNEDGTEASAITYMPMVGCLPDDVVRPHKTFYADHPFMYMIVNEESHIIYFIGQYTGE